jgi:hypothetical protein
MSRLMSDSTLILLANEVRGKTLRLIEPVSEEQARSGAPGMNNSILWHAGHSLVVVEHLGVAPLNEGKLTYPAGYFETFSWKSNPTTVTTWPTLAEMKAKLAEQRDRLVALLEKTDAATLDRVNDAKGRTVRYSILHGLHDEAGHQGEIWLIRKLITKN